MSAALDGRQTAQLLMQRVSRAFYSPRQSILLDQLIQKPAMKDDELAGRMAISTKELLKTAQPLLQDQLLKLFTRNELKEGAMKATARNYYYIDYSHATDVIKWRMWSIQHTIDDQLRNELQSQGFVCPTCNKSFSTLDAGGLIDYVSGRLLCDVCGSEVADNDTQAEAQSSKDRMERLIKQTTRIRDLLKDMEKVTLPKFDAAQWVEENVGAGAKPLPGADDGAGGPKQAAVRIELQADEDEEAERRKREREAEEKRAQNQLPSWIANSTISGEASSRQLELQAKAAAANGKYAHSDHTPASTSLDPLSAYESKPDSSALAAADSAADEDDLDSYYANLAAEEEQSALQAAITDSVTLAPSSTVDSPMLASSVGTPAGASAEDDDEAAAALEAQLAAPVALDPASAKRAREESGEQQMEGVESTSGSKKARKANDGTEYSESAPPASDSAAADELDEGEFEDDEDDEDEDPNPMVLVAGREVPFLEVTAQMQDEMTPEEYEAYFAVHLRIGE